MSHSNHLTSFSLTEVTGKIEETKGVLRSNTLYIRDTDRGRRHCTSSLALSNFCIFSSQFKKLRLSDHFENLLVEAMKPTSNFDKGQVHI